MPVICYSTSELLDHSELTFEQKDRLRALCPKEPTSTVISEIWHILETSLQGYTLHQILSIAMKEAVFVFKRNPESYEPESMG